MLLNYGKLLKNESPLNFWLVEIVHLKKKG